jgi:PKD repeat protein
VYRTKSNIALKNNGGDVVKLYQPGAERANTTFTYHEKAPMGQSCIKKETETAWTKTPTPGAKNIFVLDNRPPNSEVIFPTKGIEGEELFFDASDTFDPERDPLVFQWDFGDGQRAYGDYVRHIFVKAGEYTVSLRVSDGTHEEKSTRHIAISKKDREVQKNFLPVAEKINDVRKEKIISDIIVEQVYPNPTGRDTTEFISLKNISTTPMDISGWNIQTEKYAKPFIFPSESILLPQKNMIVRQEQSGLRLQNASDAVYLFTAEGNLADSVDYEDAPEDRILMRAKDGVWKWMKPTTIQGNEEKIIVVSALKNKKNQKIKKSAQELKNMSVGARKENTQETAIEHIRALETGTSVRFRAVVSVEPGILGKTVFYVAGSGIQMYHSKGDFPQLRIGDVIDVVGILQESGSEMRIRISGKDAVRVIVHGNPPRPQPLETSAIGEESEGYFVHIQGEVVEVRWPYIFLDDGSGEVRVYVKKSTGIEKRKLYVGDELSVTGIVSQTPAGYRVLPRYESDIVLVKKPEKEQTNEEALPDRTQETKTIFQYITAIGITAALVSLGLFIQYRMKE